MLAKNQFILKIAALLQIAAILHEKLHVSNCSLIISPVVSWISCRPTYFLESHRALRIFVQIFR